MERYRNFIRVNLSMKEAYVYILANKKHGTIYVGVTSDLVQRIYQHKTNAIEGFTQKYDVKDLVYYESSPSIVSAIAREKQLKHWNRDWKIKLIGEFNPTWRDLYDEIK